MTLKEMEHCATETLSYFLETMSDVPFSKNDIIFKFAHQRDFPNCVKKLCEKYSPNRILNENQVQQLKTSIFANAIVGREKSAIAVCIDCKTNYDRLRSILFHELMHIFCAKVEIDGPHFIDIYGSDVTPDPSPEEIGHDTCVNAGYVVWSEFIAEYFARIKTNTQKHTFNIASDNIFKLLSDITISNPNNKTSLAMACVDILTCKDVEETLSSFDESNFKDSDNKPYEKEARAAFKRCLELLHNHIQREKPWKITEDFMVDLGGKYMFFTTMNSLFFGKVEN